jgi:hypothetical protein
VIDEMLILAAGVNRVVEFIKQALGERFALPAWVTLGLSLALSVFAAFAMGLNMFAEFGSVPVNAGIVVTGLVVGMGSNAIHSAFDILTYFKDRLSDKPVIEAIEA